MLVFVNRAINTPFVFGRPGMLPNETEHAASGEPDAAWID